MLQRVRQVDLPAETPPERLRAARRVFADSRAAIAYAYEQGLRRDAEIVTTSPALLLDSTLPVARVERVAAAGPFADLAAATLPFTRRLYAELKADPELSAAALIVAQVGLIFSTIAEKALLLEEDDFTPGIAIAQTDSGDATLNSRINAPWANLLGASEPSVVREPADRFRAPAIDPRERTTFFDRQRLGGFEKIGYQAMRAVAHRLPFRAPRGALLILRENELLRETALHLMLRGYGPRDLRPPAVEPSELSPLQAGRLARIVRAAVHDYVRGLTPKGAASALASTLEKRASAWAADCLAALPAWRRKLDEISAERPRLVLMNMVTSPAVAAMQAACHERGLPVVAFQHGVAREINMYNGFAEAYFEGNQTDLFLAFNPEAAAVSEASTMNRARCLTVGVPALYWRCGSFRSRRPDGPPILYASTMQYVGSVNMAALSGVSDLWRARTELALLDDVFGRLPHRVLYKTYPQSSPLDYRYLDPDPATERAAKTANVELYASKTDLRFLIPDARVLVSSRATSTISWCLLSGKPVVFIDYPYDKPLRPQARRAFDEGVFLFDGGDPRHRSRLREFLSQPLDEIDRLWAARADARAQLIERFVGSGGPGAGVRAARLLHDFVARAA